MKLKSLLVIALTIIALQLNAQKPIKDSIAYAMGVQMAKTLKQGYVLDKIDLKIFTEAMADVLKDKARLDDEQCRSIISPFIAKAYENEKTKNAAEGKAFLEKNKTQAGVVTLPSGLQYKIERNGNGNKPVATDQVEVHYKGTLLDGREFDSSYSRKQSVTFPLNKVIPGWTEGMQQIDEGGKIILYVPAELAYGESSPQGSIIGPSSTLIFEIELIKIQPTAGQQLIQPQPIKPIN